MKKLIVNHKVSLVLVNFHPWSSPFIYLKTNETHYFILWNRQNVLKWSLVSLFLVSAKEFNEQAKKTLTFCESLPTYSILVGCIFRGITFDIPL